MIKEACVEGYSHALIADSKQIDRIELCENLAVGGVTPSYGSIRMSKEKCKNSRLFVIIRPRGGNFCYSPQEFDVMKSDIEICRQLKVDGVVTGVLTRGGEIDLSKMEELIKLSRPMDVTFHMAFDELDDPLNGIETCIDLGVDRILTKGGKGCAMENIENLKRYVEEAKGRIAILVGGKVTYENVKYIQKETGAKEFHGRRIVRL